MTGVLLLHAREIRARQASRGGVTTCWDLRVADGIRSAVNADSPHLAPSSDSSPLNTRVTRSNLIIAVIPSHPRILGSARSLDCRLTVVRQWALRLRYPPLAGHQAYRLRRRDASIRSGHGRSVSVRDGPCDWSECEQAQHAAILLSQQPCLHTHVPVNSMPDNERGPNLRERERVHDLRCIMVRPTRIIFQPAASGSKPQEPTVSRSNAALTLSTLPPCQSVGKVEIRARGAAASLGPPLAGEAC